MATVEDRRKKWVQDQIKAGLRAEVAEQQSKEITGFGGFNEPKAGDRDLDDEVLAGASAAPVKAPKDAPPRSYASSDLLTYEGLRGRIRELEEQALQRSQPWLTPEERKTEARSAAESYRYIPPEKAPETHGQRVGMLAARTIPLRAPLSEETGAPETAREGMQRTKRELQEEAEEMSLLEVVTGLWKGPDPLTPEQAKESGLALQPGLLRQTLERGIDVGPAHVGLTQEAKDEPVRGLYDIGESYGPSLLRYATGMAVTPERFAQVVGLLDDPGPQKKAAVELKLGEYTAKVGAPWMVDLLDTIPAAGENAAWLAGRMNTEQYLSALVAKPMVASATATRAAHGAVSMLDPVSEPAARGVAEVAQFLGSTGIVPRAQAAQMSAFATKRADLFVEGASMGDFDALGPLVEAYEGAETEGAKRELGEDILKNAGALSWQSLRAKARAERPSVEKALRLVEAGEVGGPDFERFRVAAGAAAPDKEQLQRILDSMPLRDLPASMQAKSLPTVERIVGATKSSRAAKDKLGITAFEEGLGAFGAQVAFRTEGPKLVESSMGKLGRAVGILSAMANELDVSPRTFFYQMSGKTVDTDVVAADLAEAVEAAGWAGTALSEAGLRGVGAESAADFVVAAGLGLVPESARAAHGAFQSVARLPLVPTGAGLDYYFASGGGNWLAPIVASFGGDVAGYKGTWRLPDSSWKSRFYASNVSGDIARVSEVLGGLHVPEDAAIYRSTLLGETLLDAFVDWEGLAFAPVSAALRAGKAGRVAASTTGGLADAARVAASADPIEAVSASVEANARKAVLEGRGDFDKQLPPDFVASVREVLRVAGSDPDKAMAAVRQVSGETSAQHVLTMLEMLKNGSPEAKRLEKSAGWQATRKVLDDEVVAGRLDEGDADFYMAALSATAYRLAADPEAGIKSPEEFFARVQHVRGGQPGAGALYAGAEGGGIAPAVQAILDEPVEEAAAPLGLWLKPEDVAEPTLLQEIQEALAGAVEAAETALTPEETERALPLVGLLVARAEQLKPVFDRAVAEVAAELGGDVKLAKVKKPERAARKLVKDYNFDDAKLQDILRATIVVPTLEDVAPALDAVRERFDVVRVKDRFASPMNGYSDVLLNVRMEDGFVAEIQIHIPEMLAVKDIGHDLYVRAQNLPDEHPDAVRALALTRRLYGEARRAAETRLRSVSTMASNVARETGIPLRRAEDQGKGLGSGSKATQSEPVITTGTSSTSKRVASEGMASREITESSTENIITDPSLREGEAPFVEPAWGPADDLWRSTVLPALRGQQSALGLTDEAIEVIRGTPGLVMEALRGRVRPDADAEVQILQRAMAQAPGPLQQALARYAREVDHARMTEVGFVVRPALYEGDDGARAPMFYSALRRAVSGLKQTTFQPEQLLGVLRKTPGVKTAEVEATGLVRFLADKKAITKQEVLDWLDEHRVRIEEKVLSRGEDDPQIKEILDELNEYRRQPAAWRTADENRQIRALETRLEELTRELGIEAERYERFALPGGRNYREILLKLPFELRSEGIAKTRRVLVGFLTSMAARYGADQRAIASYDGAPAAPYVRKAIDELIAKMSAEERAKYKELEGQFSAEAAHRGTPMAPRYPERVFRSQHFQGSDLYRDDSYGLLAHIRLTDHLGTDGKRYLLVQELQSDAAQRYRDLQVKQAKAKKVGGELSPQELAELEMLRAFLGPFAATDRWTALALKRVLYEATSGRYDGIAWTLGIEQVQRYEDATRQVVDQIMWSRGEETQGTIRVLAVKAGATVYDKVLTSEELPGVLGKGMAGKILASQDATGVLSGPDLAIGGEGMRIYYDEIVPKVAEELTKAWSGKVGAARVATGERAVQMLSPGGWLHTAYRRLERLESTRPEDWKPDPFTPSATSLREEVALLREGIRSIYLPTAEVESTPVHVLPMTREMSRAILGQGQPILEGTGGPAQMPLFPGSRHAQLLRPVKKAAEKPAPGDRTAAVESARRMSMGALAKHVLGDVEHPNYDVWVSVLQTRLIEEAKRGEDKELQAVFTAAHRAYTRAENWVEVSQAQGLVRAMRAMVEQYHLMRDGEVSRKLSVERGGFGSRAVAKAVDAAASMGIMSPDTHKVTRAILDAMPEGALDRVSLGFALQPDTPEGRATWGKATRAVEAALALADTADHILTRALIYFDPDYRMAFKEAVDPETAALDDGALLRRAAQDLMWRRRTDAPRHLAQRIAEGRILIDELASELKSTGLRPELVFEHTQTVNRLAMHGAHETGILFTVVHELAHALHDTFLGDAEHRILTTAYNRTLETTGLEGETAYVRGFPARTVQSYAEWFADNFSEYVIFHKLPALLEKMPEAPAIKAAFDRMLERLKVFWRTMKKRDARAGVREFDPGLVDVIDRFFEGKVAVVETPEEFARRYNLLSSIAQLYERDAPPPRARMSVAITGARPEFPDLQRAVSAYQTAAARSAALEAKMAAAGAALTPVQQRVYARAIEEAKAAQARLVELMEGDLRRAFEGSPIQPVNLRTEGGVERSFGVWAGDPMEPGLRMEFEVSGPEEVDIVRGRLSRFSRAFQQGGQLVLVEGQRTEVPSVFLEPRDLTPEEMAPLITTTPGGRRAATLVVQFGQGRLDASTVAALQRVMGRITSASGRRIELGWTLAYERGQLIFAHAPEWASDPSPETFLQDARDALAALHVYAQRAGIHIDADWRRDDVLISGPSTYSSNGFTIHGYDTDILQGHAAEQRGALSRAGEAQGPAEGAGRGAGPGPEALGRAPGAGPPVLLRGGEGPAAAAGREAAGDGDLAPAAAGAEDEGLVARLVGDLGAHLDKVGATPHKAIDEALAARIDAAPEMSETERTHVKERLRLGKVSKLAEVEGPVEGADYRVRLLRTDGQVALLPSGELLSFADMDYLRRRPVWLDPPFTRPEKSDAERAALWKRMGLPDDLADEAAGLVKEPTRGPEELDVALISAQQAYEALQVPLYDRHTRSLGISRDRPKPKLRNGKPTKDYLEKLRIHMMDQLGIHLFTQLSNGTNIVMNQLLVAAVRPRSRAELARTAERIRRARAAKGAELSKDEALAFLALATTIGDIGHAPKFMGPDYVLGSTGARVVGQRWWEEGAPRIEVGWDEVVALNQDMLRAFIEDTEEKVAAREANIAKLEARAKATGKDLSKQLATETKWRDKYRADLEEVKTSLPDTATPKLTPGLTNVSSADPVNLVRLLVDFDDDLRRVEAGEQLYSWYEPHPDETEAEFVVRIQSSTPGMGSKIANFSVAMTMPSTANAAAIDTHMIKRYVRDILGEDHDPLMRSWFESWQRGKGTHDYGNIKPTEQQVAARQSWTYEDYLSGQTEDWVGRVQVLFEPIERKTRPGNQPIDPAARRAEVKAIQAELKAARKAKADAETLQALRNKLGVAEGRLKVQTWAAKWQERYGANPKLQSILDGNYRATADIYEHALGLFRKDPEKAARGLSTFTIQWLRWDQLRHYYEPEAAVYSGAASIPGYGQAALRELYEMLGASGALWARPRSSKLPMPQPAAVGGDPLRGVLFKLDSEGPVAAFEWDARAHTALIRLLRTADLDALLHERGHLLVHLLGKKWGEQLVRYFDHEPDGKGGVQLTVRGHEQAAEALRWYWRTREAPHGRMRALFDRLWVSLQNIVQTVRRKPGLLPPGMAAAWDLTLRPDGPLRDRALRLTERRLKRVPVVRLAPTPAERLAEERVVGAGRAREAERVDLRPEVVRQRLGLKAGQTEVDAVELVTRAVAYVATERFRKGFSGHQDLVRLTTRAIVPRSRVETVQGAVRRRMLAALGGPPEGLRVEEGQVKLDAPAQAGLRVLLGELASEPLGNALPADLLEPGADLASIPVEQYNQVVEVLVDVKAGPGSSRMRSVEEGPATVGYRFWRSLRNFTSEQAKTSERLRAVQDEITKTFKVIEPGEGYLSPDVQEVIGSRIRQLNGVHGWVVQQYEMARQRNPRQVIDQILRGIAASLEQPVAVPHLPMLLALDEAFREVKESGGLTMSWLGARVDGLADVLTWRGRATETELTALRMLRQYADVLEQDPQAAARFAADHADALGDAVRVASAGVSARLRAMEERAHQIGVALGGSRDANIMLNRTPEDKAAVYRWFHTGDFEALLDWAGRRGREVGTSATRVPQFEPATAVLEMLARLRAQTVLAGLAADLTRLGIDTTEEGLAATRALGDIDRTKFRDNVLHYLNNEISWDATRQIARDTEAPLHEPTAPAAGQARLHFPRRFDDIGNVHDLEAYTKAHEILERFGFKHGKGEWNAVTLDDGTEMLLPQMVIDELAEAMDRAAQVGTAFRGQRTLRDAVRIGGRTVKRTLKVKLSMATGKTLDTMLGAFGFTFRVMNTGLTTGVIIPNPAYYVGNFVGGIFQTYQKLGLIGAGDAMFGRPRLTAAVIARLWKDGRYTPDAPALVDSLGRVWTADQLAVLAERYGLKGSFLRAETVKSLARDLRDRDRRGWKRMMNAPGWWQDTLTSLADASDNYFRVAIFLRELDLGHSPAAAAETARSALFDYSRLTERERTVFRRGILFYSFLRQNQNLFWDTLLTHPGRILAMVRLLHGMNATYLEEEPELVVSEHNRGRLGVYFRTAAYNGHRTRQVATLAPQLPALAAMELWTDLFEVASTGDESSVRGLVSKINPMLQAPFAMATERDIFFGRDLRDYNEVPSWMVEVDRMLFGGIVTTDILGVQPQPAKDASRSDTPGEVWFQATNEKAWWLLRNLVQLPGFGRGMDTLTMADRANLGPVEAMVVLARAAREEAEEPGLVREMPKGTLDTAGPRGGFTRAEEARGLFGFRPVAVPTRGAAADRLMEEQNRRMLERVKELEATTQPYRYE